MTKDEFAQRLQEAENNPDPVGRLEAKVNILVQYLKEHKVTPR